MRGVPACAAALLLAGCLEFEDPLIPERESPAILVANVRVFDAGALLVDGTLSPGRDAAGFLRVVQVPFVTVNGHHAEPVDVDERGVRRYQSSFPGERDATSGPFDIAVPDVRGVGPIPPVRFHGLRRVGPDTLRLPAGSDIVLRVDTVGAATPAALSRQWFLEVRSGGPSFRLSADAAPPAQLRIPTEFLTPGPRADISLIYYQTVQQRDAAGTYISNVVLDTRMNWVVLFEDES
jgi:hypothetical protein